ncbi:hypothetical protein CIG75_13990 [Tumebacillus algifaecis]|uniref:Uncharacterized protein n=1 Tax=Tumebacillus algifaecis TaxID=1214604 RepID=A0A223D2T1_9BACL|nr:hypothetical protein [Tumebacillus algifaecis]ASS75959.1 hypothetical protein CIG75_13990 [Tumebacillus algifaecis]
MKKRLFWSIALLAELTVLVVLYRLYKDVEWRIFLVQGQEAYRYAELHQEWLAYAGAMVLVGISLPFTIYFLTSTFRKKRG